MIEENRCPRCLIGMVSLRDERKYHGAEAGTASLHRNLVPVAIDRAYTCDNCGYMATYREPVLPPWLSLSARRS
jgi:hypothetical protein